MANIYIPHAGTVNFRKQTLLDINAHIDLRTIIMGDFNTPLSPIDRSSRQKKSIKKLQN
jgi:hypothetical protein